MDRIGLPLPWGIVPTERLFQPITGANPVAGAEVLVPVPGGQVWVVQSVRVPLVTAVAVGNRRPSLIFDDGTTEFARAPAGLDVPATTTAALTWFREAAFGGVVGANGAVSGPLPPTVLLPGYRIRTLTLNLQAADAYGAPVLYVASYEVRGLERAARRYLEAVAGTGIE